jgi:diketogulonate reductase-like aldo/keto reductase
VIG